jgi:putative addiction module component (TIGR02574 family)
VTTSQVRELALGLPLQERARLARELIDSLEPDTPDPGVEEAWIEEIDARAEALERGEAKAYDGQASLDQIRQELRQGRGT